MAKKSWEIFDRFYNAHWFLTGYSCRNFSELLRDGGNTDITKFIGVMDHDVNLMIFNPRQFDRAAHFYADKLINDHAWRKEMYAKHDYYTHRYFQAGERFRKLPFHNFSNRQLVQSAKKMTKLQEQVRILGVTLNGLVIDGRNHLSTKLREGLQASIGNDKDFGQHWSLVTQVTHLSMRQKKDRAVARLAKDAKKQPVTKVKEKLRKIYEQYCWLDYMYYGPPATFEQYQEDLQSAIQNNIHLHAQREFESIAKRQKELMKLFKFNRQAQHFVRLAQYVLWQKWPSPQI